MVDLLSHFNVFSNTMETDLRFFRGNRFIYRYLSREAFDIYAKFIWLLGLILNIMIAIDIEIIDGCDVRHKGDSLTTIIRSTNTI